MTQVTIRLKTTKSMAEVTSAEDAIEVQLPLTRQGWEDLETVQVADRVTLQTSDGALYAVTVMDAHEGTYTVWVENPYYLGHLAGSR